MKAEVWKEWNIPEQAITADGLQFANEGQNGLVFLVNGDPDPKIRQKYRLAARVFEEMNLDTCILDLWNMERQNLWPSREETVDSEHLEGLPVFTLRLYQVNEALRMSPVLKQLRIGYFALGRDAGSVLLVDSYHPGWIGAVSAVHGQYDCVSVNVTKVAAPTMLVVGSDDTPGIRENRLVYHQLRTERELVIIPEVGSTFSETGAMETALRLSGNWLGRHLQSKSFAH